MRRVTHQLQTMHMGAHAYEAHVHHSHTLLQLESLHLPAEIQKINKNYTNLISYMYKKKESCKAYIVLHVYCVHQL